MTPARSGGISGVAGSSPAVWAGSTSGSRPPGSRSPSSGHGLAMRALRTAGVLEAGITLNLSHVTAASDSAVDLGPVSAWNHGPVAVRLSPSLVPSALFVRPVDKTVPISIRLDGSTSLASPAS